MNTNEYTNDHLFNVHMLHGLNRMTGFEVEDEFGKDVWDNFGSHIEHSEWCPVCPVEDTAPPF